MKYYTINHSNNKIEGYQSSFDGIADNFNFDDHYKMMFEVYLRCSFSYFVFYYNF